MRTEQMNFERAGAPDGSQPSLRNGLDRSATAETIARMAEEAGATLQAVDLSEAQRFLSMLDPTATRFTFQTFNDVKGRKRPDLAAVHHGTLTELKATLVGLNQQGAGLFVTVNETDHDGRGSGNIVRARAVWQDDDAGHDWDVSLEPSIVVNTSPGKYQRYLLADGLTLEEHAAALDVMVQKHGCDKGAKGVNRVLRLPGFFHMKQLDSPYLVRIVEATGKRYGRAEILAALPPIPRPDSRRTNAELNAKFKLLDEAEIARVRSAAEHLHKVTDGREFEDRATWLDWGMALHHAAGGNEQGFALWCELSKLHCPTKHDRDDQRRVWDSFKDDKDNKLTLGTIYRRANDHGWAGGWPELVRVEKRVRTKTGGTEFKTSYKPAAKSKENIAAFLEQSGIAVYWDEFARDFMIERAKDRGRIDDHAVRSLWFEAQALGLPVHGDREFFIEAIKDIARADVRNPVKDYLARVEAAYRTRVAKVGPPAPGKALIETLLIKYAGAEDTPLNRAFVRKWLIATVRRARKPGTKFDAMVVLESPEGMGKSTLPKVLASTEWFEENLAFGASPRVMIQQSAGKWIIEMAELVGIGIKEIEAIKTQLSRTHDRSDLKYDKFATDAPRHFVFIGTTNDSTYLRSKTGNRRFWPIAITKEITEKRIAAIRDHLWGEAAYYEAEDESIELPRELWSEAREAQQKREVVDPILERIEPWLAGRHGRVSVDVIYALLGYASDDVSRKNDQGIRTRIGLAMGQLGWEYQRWARRYIKPGPDGRVDVEILVGAYRPVEPDGSAP